MSQSPAELLMERPADEREAFISSLSEAEAESLLRRWRGFLARPEQLAPEGDWDIWMILAGRGFGKTRSGSEWVREEVEAGRANRIALVGETQRDLEKVMIEGDSGLLSVCSDLIENYTKKPVQIRFSNGALALGFNATEPDQLRGPQFDLAWSDELAKWKYARDTWDQLQFGLRLGEHPRQIVTTTPRPIELVRAIVAQQEGQAAITRGRMRDNAHNLADSFIKKIETRYGGTRLGRQELEGQILGDMPGALWHLSDIDLYRVQQKPDDFDRILVAIDPAVTAGEDADEHGLIVAGLKGQEAYVLEDASLRGTPFEWAKRADVLYKHYHADGVVVEVNQGGDMVKQTLRAVNDNMNIIEVRASRGKHVRAEPIAALYEQGRVHHVGAFPELENQMCMMTNQGYEGEDSPDRLDALVWVMSKFFPDLAENDDSGDLIKALYGKGRGTGSGSYLSS